jgi:tetratricopeptide (TPR) repeat protein
MTLMKKIAAILLLLIPQLLSSQVEINDQEIDSLILKGRTRLALKKLKSSEDSFEKHVKIATIYYQVDQTKKAIESYKKALLIKEDYKTKIQLGKSYQKIKNHLKAIEIYEEILKDDPLNLLIRYQLGKLYLTKRRANKAIKTFNLLYSIDKSNANYSYQKGVAYAMKKDANAMVDSFLEAYEVDSTHVKSLFQLANSYVKLNDPDSTKLFLDKGLALEPNHINLNRLKVNKTYKEKRYNITIEVLQKLDTLAPGDIFVVNMFGKTYYNSGEYEKAKEYFEKSKNMDRSNFKTWTYLGHIEMKLENYQRAMMNYRLASYMGKEKRDEEYYGMGHGYLKLKQPKMAMAMFHKAYQEDRGNHKAMYQHAKTSDDYYKDKKKVYKLYDEYVMQFENMDKDLTAYVKSRMKEIKRDYFMRGEKLEE